MFRCRSSRLRTCPIAALGLASLVFVGAVDLHASALHPSTFETPHPAIQSYGGVTQPHHIEPADDALRPGHEPLVRSRVAETALPPALWAEPSNSTARKIWQRLDPAVPRTGKYRTPSLRAPPAFAV
jgi:hypothetical protein